MILGEPKRPHFFKGGEVFYFLLACLLERRWCPMR
jgi:hypothetical protein